MRIIKLFKNHILALFAAVALIIITCNADLMLPAYMSAVSYTHLTLPTNREV